MEKASAYMTRINGSSAALTKLCSVLPKNYREAATTVAAPVVVSDTSENG
jgi:hypothetical protein